jgi:uncharacterized protein (DUF2249 family)/quercetin dioxygenase-like cupin family protein
MSADELDVRALRGSDQHPPVFARFDALRTGESFVLVDSHDPRPLLEEFETGRAGSYGWDYLDQGPDSWRIRITRLASTPLPRVLCDTTSLDVSPTAAGAIWRLQPNPRDLDANIIQLPAGEGIDAHPGPELDVLLVVLDGSGTLTTERGVVDLRAGAIVWLPRHAHRQFAAGPEGLRYLTVHQRRPARMLAPTTPGRAGGQRAVPGSPTS